MQTCFLAFSANAGVSLTVSGVRIWIDLLHKRKINEFSAVGPELWAKIQKSPDFCNPDVICYTHCHSDHYSFGMTEEARALFPAARILLPEPDFDGQTLLTGDEVRDSVGNVALRFLKTEHGGDLFRDAKHYSICIDAPDARIFFAGDAKVPPEELEPLFAVWRPDIALVPFTWSTLRRGRLFLKDVVQPEHLVLLHIPFPEDDVYQYCGPILHSVERLQFLPDVRLLLEPGQTETF